MCASYLIISPDHAQVKQVVGETQEITRLVATRSEDVTFAMNLGTVLLDHLIQMTELDSMTLMGELCRLARWSIITSALLLYPDDPAQLLISCSCCCCHNYLWIISDGCSLSQSEMLPGFHAKKQQHFKG